MSSAGVTDTSTDVPTAPFRDARGDGAALLILDMINRFDFEEAAMLEPRAARAADAILALRAEADSSECPVIYVNDNFGAWHSQASKLVEEAQEASGSDVPHRLAPRDCDYFVIKPQYSGFYSTNLGVLLPKLGVRRLIVTGIATDICVLVTAADAHMRDYALWVPEDAVAAATEERDHAALDIIRRGMGAVTDRTGALTIAQWEASRSGG